MDKNSLQQDTSSNRNRIVRLVVLGSLCWAAACTADSAVAPEFETRIRKAEFRCASEGTGATPPDTVTMTSGDACPEGYDHIPWY